MYISDLYAGNDYSDQSHICCPEESSCFTVILCQRKNGVGSCLSFTDIYNGDSAPFQMPDHGVLWGLNLKSYHDHLHPGTLRLPRHTWLWVLTLCSYLI